MASIIEVELILAIGRLEMLLGQNKGTNIINLISQRSETRFASLKGRHSKHGELRKVESVKTPGLFFLIFYFCLGFLTDLCHFYRFWPISGQGAFRSCRNKCLKTKILRRNSKFVSFYWKFSDYRAVFVEKWRKGAFFLFLVLLEMWFLTVFGGFYWFL